MIKTVEELVLLARREDASDLHLVAGTPPKIRVNGTLYDADPMPLTPEDCVEYATQLIGRDACEQVLKIGECDTSRNIRGIRCRLNIYKQQGNISVSLRLLMNDIPALETLGLPDVAKKVVDMRRGLVLVTGETGAGKSTTLAAMIDRICHTQSAHVITLEDPIEYIYSTDRGLVNQREIGLDTESFSTGTRSVLREDPDVIMIGEMRDAETIKNAIRAAETGHLVFATLHTRTASDSVNRIIDIFPAEQQPQIRMQLSGSLLAVFSQQLLPCLTGGRVLAVEVMMVSSAMRTLIRDGKTHQLDNAILTSSQNGCVSMDNSLIRLYQTGKIARHDCVIAANNQDYVKRATMSAPGTNYV